MRVIIKCLGPRTPSFQRELGSFSILFIQATNSFTFSPPSFLLPLSSLISLTSSFPSSSSSSSIGATTCFSTPSSTAFDKICLIISLQKSISTEDFFPGNICTQPSHTPLTRTKKPSSLSPQVSISSTALKGQRYNSPVALT